jgi:hypothetical protein
VNDAHNDTTKRCSPFVADLVLNKVPVQMQVDTGASVSVMSADKFYKLFPNVTIKRSNILLVTYSQQQLKLVGEVEMNVKYKDKLYALNLKIVNGNGPTLLGRDWLQYIKLDWRNVFTL